MQTTLLKILLELLIISPILIFFLINNKVTVIKIVLVLYVYFAIHQSLLNLPIEFENLKLFSGKWNWTGKFYAIIWSFTFLAFYKRFGLKDYFLVFKQNQKFVKNGLLIIAMLLSIHILMNTFFSSSQKFDIETLLYQLTMPGIDEEIAYRGIMLGLLVKILKPTIRVFNINLINPAILISAILFGLAHGLKVSIDYEIIFNTSSFLSTMALGIIWGWLTLKSGSVLFAMLSHNLGNIAQIVSIR